MKILSQFIFEKLILAKQIEEKLILNKNTKIQNRNNIYKFIEVISYLYLEHYKYSNEPHYNILEIYKKIKNLIAIYELNNTKYNIYSEKINNAIIIGFKKFLDEN